MSSTVEYLPDPSDRKGYKNISKLLHNPGILEAKRHEGLPQNQATGPVHPGNLEYGSASIKTPNKEAYL